MPKTKRTKKTRTVPYARGFHPRSLQQSTQAIGFGVTPSVPLELQPTADHFPAIPNPTSIDDWLAQYNETGQTYKQFLDDCPWLSRRKWKYMKQTFVPNGTNIRDKYPEGVICLLPIGGFDDLIAPSSADLAEYVKLFFCLPVHVLPAVELRQDGDTVLWVDPAARESGKGDGKPRPVKLQCRYDRKSGHTQLTVHSVLTQLKQSIPDNALCLIGFTMSDLYDTKPDLFVAGMASGNRRVGVFSFYRYNPTLRFSTEFWYDISRLKTDETTDEMKRVVLQRSCKLIVHEIAHLMGVDHCIWFSCCMNGSGHIAEDFKQPMFLCPVDLRKLQTLCGFDVLSRYQGMLTFFLTHRMREEADWLQKRIAFITSAQPSPQTPA